MKPFESKHLITLLGALAVAFSGCASDGSKPPAQQTAQQIEAPQTVVSGPDKSLFSKALKAQNAGQFESATQLWKNFLSKNPDSFEGHNNLGLVYYTQDMVSQALQEFETAYQLNPVDERIRKNLVRGLRFKVSMLHENREYFKTLEALVRLEQIVEPEEKRAILFKQEQVEDQVFLQVIKADNSPAYQDFINRFPDGLNAVRAREYLEKHSPKTAKTTSQSKSWMSPGKTVKSSSGTSGDLSSWASADQPPDYGSSRPTATYTPPPAGAEKKKAGDFFGTDSAAVEDVKEENVAATQEMDSVAAIPFEDFEKPERSNGEQGAAQAPVKGKESLRVAGEIRGEPDEGAAGLDTLPDLKPSPAVALPEEMDASQSTNTVAGDIKMQTAEQEQAKTETASVEETVEQTNKEVESSEPEPVESESDRIAQILKEEIPQVENAEPEQAPSESIQEPEPVQEMEAELEAIPEEMTTEEASVSKEVESSESEPVESESDRIARIVREEVAKAESAEPEQAQPESFQEPEPVQEMETALEAIPEEKTMGVASVDPGDHDANQATVLAESPPIEETPAPDPEEKKTISQETISETVAALVPSLPQAEATETPGSPDSIDSSSTMVVVQMGEGSTLNVRANPSTQGEILGYLEDGDMMPFMSESGDWYQIEIEEGLSGWISKKFSKTRNVTSVASVPVPEPEGDMASELSSPESEQQRASVARAGAMVLVTVEEDSTLNVRSLPSSNGAVVDMLFGGDKLPLVKEQDGWYQVQFEDETTGWISKKFSVLEGGAPAASSEASLSIPVPKKKKASNEMVTTVVVIKVPEGSSLNVRSTPSSQGQVLGILKRGEMRPLLEEMGEWYQVELQDGQSGWISQKFSGKMNVDPSFVQNP